jgi:hypothetical protein
MRSVEEIVNHILGQLRMVRDEPVPFFVAVLGAAIAIWLAMGWRYGGVIDNQNSEIASLQEQLNSYKSVFGNAAPEQILKRIADLQNKISLFQLPRRLTSSEKEMLSIHLKPIAAKLKGLIVYSESGSESRRYASDFLDLLRDLKTKPNGPHLSFMIEESQSGIMVGLTNPKEPSQDAKDFIAALKNSGLKVHTTLWSVAPNNIRDFDLFIGPQ